MDHCQDDNVLTLKHRKELKPKYSQRILAIEIATRAISEKMVSCLRETLLKWIQETTARYLDIEVTNFNSSWRNGLAFNAIIHRYRPDLIDYRICRLQTARDNIERAFKISERHLGVKCLSRLEEVYGPKPNEKSIIIYLKQLHRVLQLKAPSSNTLLFDKRKIESIDADKKSTVNRCPSTNNMESMNHRKIHLSIVTINNPIVMICMLLSLPFLILTSSGVSAATDRNSITSSLDSGINKFNLLDDENLPAIRTINNNVNVNTSNIDAIVDSAFDDVNTVNINNRNNGSNSNNGNNTNTDNNDTPNNSEVSSIPFGGLSPINTGINSDIPPPEDKQRTLEVVRQAHQNLLEPVIKTNKSSAFLSCETGEMIVKINFTEPFRGIAYADYDRSSPCKFFGDGSDYYELHLPLKGCGTKQEAPRLFLNNIIVRYHRLLELEEDEIKTIVCRYPPPQAPPPPPPPVGPPERIIDAPPEPAKLTQYEPLVMIAGLLFFTLMILGLGTGSYLVKRHNIKPVHTPLPPPPLMGHTDHETYLDNQSIITTEDIDTINKNTLFYSQPHLDTQYLDDTFVTTTHEIDTRDDIVHHTDTKYFRPLDLGTQNFEDTYITNHEDTTVKDVDTLTKVTPIPKYLVKNIEDTFITKVDEIDETEHVSTLHRKNIKKQEPPAVKNTSTTIVDETTAQQKSERIRTINTDDNISTTFSDLTTLETIPKPIKPELTTTDQFEHLQTFVDIFNETTTKSTKEILTNYEQSHTTSTNDYHDTVTNSIRKKFKPKISRMPDFDRITLRSLLIEDETFRALVMDTSVNDAKIPIIRHNPDYTNKLTIDTWSIFEEMLEEANYVRKHHRSQNNITKRTEEMSYHEESSAQIYEQIGHQQHYYNYDHVKQLPSSFDHVADPDFDSRTYTKSSGESESRESLSPEPLRRIKGRREERASYNSSSKYEQQHLAYDRSKIPGNSIPSLLSDPDLQPQMFDADNSDEASVPDYGDNFFDGPTSLNSIVQVQRYHNQPTSKDTYNNSYRNKAYVSEERYMASTSHDDHNGSDDYSSRYRRSNVFRNGSPEPTYNIDVDQDGVTNWNQDDNILNADQYDNEDSYPVYTRHGDHHRESPHEGTHRSKKSSSSNRKRSHKR